MSGSWGGSMGAALAASLGRPQWWVMALAGFLVRGGIVIVLLPLIALPSAPALATALAPTIEQIAISRQSLEAAVIAAALIGLVVVVLIAAALVGSWLDNALARDAEVADELDLRPTPSPISAWTSLAIRLIAHVPTYLVLGYAIVRIVVATYDELLSPGDPALPIVMRVFSRAPDAIAATAIVWLIAEALGGIAERRAAEGEPASQALRGAVRDLLGLRGVATFVVTDASVLGVVALLLIVVGQAADHVRAYLLGGAGDISLAAALLLLVTTWLLGLAVLGAALAWRATAWTIEAAPRRPVRAAVALPDAAAAGEAPAG